VKIDRYLSIASGVVATVALWCSIVSLMLTLSRYPTASPAISAAPPVSPPIADSPVASWKVIRSCPDRTWVYQLNDGAFAVWVWDSVGHGHWDELAKGVTPDAFCASPGLTVIPAS
jgi:hypothetical protein